MRWLAVWAVRVFALGGIVGVLSMMRRFMPGVGWMGALFIALFAWGGITVAGAILLSSLRIRQRAAARRKLANELRQSAMAAAVSQREGE